jgi:formylglycine-generating enzyme required for sulfatase activity
LPEEVGAALLKMLAKAPGDRWETACAFVERLRQVERQSRLASLYERLQASADGEDWAEVLVLGGQIQAVDAGYRDVADLMAQARQRLDHSRPGAQRAVGLGMLPGWAWAIGAVGLVVVLFLGGWALGLFSAGEPPETPTVTTNVLRSTQTLMLQPATRTAPAMGPATPANTPPGASLTLGSVCDDTGCNGDEKTRSRDGVEMVYVPGGTFQMGRTIGEVWEMPVHSVMLDGFWIDRTEVTNAQYTKCVEAGACQVPTTCDWGEPAYNDASKVNHPAVCVDWAGSQAYCEWAGGRLPTEAEWEYAARGPEGFVFPWGDEFDCSRGNFRTDCSPDSYERTAPVGSFENGASWCSALDLAGNVEEWVQDWYGAYPEGPQTNPIGPETGDFRVLRGGSWNLVLTAARSTDRGALRPVKRDELGGFRCVVGSASSPSD